MPTIAKNGAASAANGGARPSTSLPEALAGAGISLKRRDRGQHRARCPECDRGKRRADDMPLTVRIDGTGATWFCFRCNWTGGLWTCPDCGGASPSRVCPCHRTQAGPAAKPSPARRVEPPPEPPRPAGLSNHARELWHACAQIAPDTPAAAYLAGRGCALPENDVRWHPRLRHPCGYVGPALVALVTDTVTGEPISLHQTWLASDGRGKAPVERPRLLLKGHRKTGGVVRLVEDAEVTLGLAVAEGLETALTVMRAFRPVWSCIDAGNLAAFPVLPGINALTVVKDRDPAGQAAADTCAERWLAAGVEVWTWQAPVEGADFNDIAGRIAS
jgi:hypothetical protein